MRRVAVLLAALGLAVVPAARAASPVVFGYPYAAACPAGGIAQDVDRWGMYECNCTSYVAWALVANRQRVDWFVPGAMDARNWSHVARLKGLPVGTRPRVAAVVVWPRLTRFGHVAYVTGVEPDGGIDVAEYNLAGASGFLPFSFDLRRDVRPRGAVFIYVPRRA